MIKKTNQNIIFSSFKESFRTINNKKSYFIMLFVVQLAFIIIVSGLFAKYAVEIGEKAQVLMEPLQNISAEMNPLETTQMLERTAGLNDVYNQLKDSVFMFIIYSIVACLLVNGAAWNTANLMVNKKPSFLLYGFMFVIVGLIFAIIGLMFLGIFVNVLTALGAQTAGFVGLVLYIFVTYFAFISFGLIRKYNVKQLKLLLRDTFVIGYKQLGVLFPSYIVVFIILVVIMAIMQRLLFASMPTLTLTLLIFVLALSWAKVFLLTAVKKVSH
ncbi:MAG: hypothetical protein V3V78_01835 [Candidatus Woesearchaeota archaeon]